MWSAKLPGRPTQFDWCVVGPNAVYVPVYLGSQADDDAPKDTNGVAAVTMTGVVAWTYPFRGAVQGVVLSADNSLLLVNGDGLDAVSTSTGAVVWSLTDYSDLISGTPVLDASGMLYGAGVGEYLFQ